MIKARNKSPLLKASHSSMHTHFTYILLLGGASKSSRDPETVDYSPRKRAEMLEITSFEEAIRVVNRGSRGIEILPGPKNVDYSPRKRPEMLEITSFDDVARVVYRGSRGIEILPGPENRGL